MMNIAPLLTPSQPTAQPTTTAGSSQGSESIFGKILGQKITDQRSPEGKLSSTPKKPSQNESPAADEQRTTSSETAESAHPAATDITASEAVPATTTNDDQQFDEPKVHAAKESFQRSIPPQLTDSTTDVNEKSVPKKYVVDTPETSTQSRIQQQDATLTKSPVNIFNDGEGTVTEKPVNSSAASATGLGAFSGAQEERPVNPASPGVNQANNTEIAAGQHFNNKLFTETTTAAAGVTVPGAGTENASLPAIAETVEQRVLFSQSLQASPPASQPPQSTSTLVNQRQETTKNTDGVITTVMQPSVIAPEKTTSAMETARSSSSMQSLWPADASLTGNETISISGYFTPAKTQQPPSPFQGNRIFPDNLPVVDADSTKGVEQKPASTLTQGLRHLASIAEQTPVTMAANSSVASHAAQQMATDTTAPLMVSLNQLTSLKSPVTDPQEKYRPFTVEPLRQQFHEQQLQIKSETNTTAGNEQQFTAKQETATATLAQGLQNSGTSSTASPLSFSEVSQAIMASGQANAAPATAQPISPTVQLSPVAHDNGVLQQVAERFQMQMHNQETTLRIQLQPAELGKLNINLIVKEGSIKAHVVAQSGQVQELLERNLTKLRGILENQGFSIEELIVSNASESISNSDLFHDQATRHQNPASTKSHFSDTPFSDTLDNIVTSGAEPATSVNITA